MIEAQKDQKGERLEEEEQSDVSVRGDKLAEETKDPNTILHHRFFSSRLHRRVEVLAETKRDRESNDCADQELVERMYTDEHSAEAHSCDEHEQGDQA